MLIKHEAQNYLILNGLSPMQASIVMLEATKNKAVSWNDEFSLANASVSMKEIIECLDSVAIEYIKSNNLSSYLLENFGWKEEIFND